MLNGCSGTDLLSHAVFIVSGKQMGPLVASMPPLTSLNDVGLCCCSSPCHAKEGNAGQANVREHSHAARFEEYEGSNRLMPTPARANRPLGAAARGLPSTSNTANNLAEGL
jgi:hypothetical protein